jgi:hypothetical protein
VLILDSIRHPLSGQPRRPRSGEPSSWPAADATDKHEHGWDKQRSHEKGVDQYTYSDCKRKLLERRNRNETDERKACCKRHPRDDDRLR